jgi:CheY-like chemotaxis protein
LRADGGRAAIRNARIEIPDLIVLDLMMPEVNGFDVIEALQADPLTAAIPIVVVSAKTLSDADRAALDGHTISILQKASFSPNRFAGEVRRALATAGSQER